MSGRRLAAALVLGAVTLAGCTGPGASPGPSADSPSAPGSFYAQRLTWTPCGRLECATASVPLDHADPTGRTLTLPLARRKATAAPRRGTLFVNPGGPGVSGTWFAAAFDRRDLEAYDIVGWDPRGVAAGARVTCLDAAAADRFDEVDFSPDDAGELGALRAATASFAAACAAHTDPALLAHLSTRETARDLDILRAAVGDDRLTFYGASYGTLIGAHYADLFPDRVGRMVLDAPVDVTGAEEVSQAAGFEASFRAFAAWCGGRPDCPLGDDGDAVAATLLGWLDGLDAAPPAVGARRLTQSLAALGMARHLYAGEEGWPRLLAAVTAARAGDPRRLLAAADAMNGRNGDGTRDPLQASGAAIRCADRAARPWAEALARWEAERVAFPFGSLLGPDLGCLDWPVVAPAWTTPRGAGAPPLLLVAATGDPATPYPWAEATARALGSAVLLPVESGAHVRYGGDPCATAAVRDYLLAGRLPAAASRCST
nr:alpha/beta hydrolase [Propionibacterium sp.]